jgi:hypothetical protein
MKKRLKALAKKAPAFHPHLLLLILVLIVIGLSTLIVLTINKAKTTEMDFATQIEQISNELENLKNQDQYKINQDLQATVSAVEETFSDAVDTYEDLLELQNASDNTEEMEELFAQTLSYLSELNYASAQANIKTLTGSIEAEFDRIASQFVIPQNVPTSNTPPGSGYARQRVSTEIGDYLVSIVTVDLNSARAVVDTATDGDCANECPVLSLADYVGRNGAFAGINGSYFCPASYPSCAGKTNSFDTLAMNKNKTYINSANNVYSTVPAVIFSGNSARFVGQSLEWGRDTGVDAVLANQPMLVSGGNVVFGGDGDPKKGSKGGRSFVGASGSTTYIGVVHNATVAESAIVLKALGIQHAINLDSGGSTALWYSGYKVGPGRALPNVLLFVNK